MRASTNSALIRALGVELKVCRLERGLTQEDLAERLNVGNEAVSRMERGTVPPSVARLHELAGIFKCSVCDLLIESSARAEEQSVYLSKLLANVSDDDRNVILDVVRKLSEHMQK